MALRRHFDSVKVLQDGALPGWCLEHLYFLSEIELRSSGYQQTSTERLYVLGSKSLMAHRETVQLESWRQHAKVLD